MKIEISYKEAIAQFPEAVQELKDKLESGTSKQKGTDPSEFSYCISWGQRVKGGSFLDMIKSGQEERERLDSMTDEERYDVDRRVNEILPSICAISLGASIGRWGSAVSIAEDGDPPQAIIDSYRESEKKNIAMEKKSDSLTPEEREKETQGLLGQLRGPGFMEVLANHKNKD